MKLCYFKLLKWSIKLTQGVRKVCGNKNSILEPISMKCDNCWKKTKLFCSLMMVNSPEVSCATHITQKRVKEIWLVNLACSLFKNPSSVRGMANNFWLLQNRNVWKKVVFKCNLKYLSRLTGCIQRSNGLISGIKDLGMFQERH